MAETNSTPINISELCRLCLCSEGNLISVLRIEDSEFTLEKIYSCLLVEILETDEVSRKICLTCLDKVNNFYSFRHLVAECQEKLGRLLVVNKENNDTSKLDDIEAELERELNRKECHCWEGDELLKTVICDVDTLPTRFPIGKLAHPSDHLSQMTDRLELSDNALQKAIHEPLIKTYSVPQSVDQLPQPIQSVPSEPGDFLLESSPVESLLDGFSTDSIPFCPQQEEKCDNPLDLRCNITGKDVLKSVITYQKCATIKNRHKCNGCSKTFSSLKNLLKHLNKHHSKNENDVCHKCNIGFKSAEQLKVHNWSHKEKYECDKCSYTSYTLVNLKLHVMKHNSEYLVICEECGKGFYRMSSYEEHKLNKHSREIVVHKCSECGKAYHSKGYLRQHLKTHSPGFSRSDYQCETCGKTFHSWKGIRRHMASAHEGNRYKCDVCSKEVTSLQSLRIHKKIHTGEKSYVCDICGKAFLRLNSLVVHRRVHSGEKPYSCQICSKSFSQRSTLNVHKRSHTGERPYPCHLCAKSFVTKTLMNTHLKTHHAVT